MTSYDSAVIFTGGKSSRMGEDKSLLPFGGEKTLAEYQYKKLKKVFPSVYLSAKNEKFDFDCPVILDNYIDSSPLVAILSIFETLEIERLFILSVDAPFVDEEVIQKIIEEDTEDVDAIVANSPSGLQPLCGLYKKSIVKLAQQQYNKKNHKLKDLLSLARTKTVEFSEDTPFTNLNHPEEYTKALALSLSQACS